MLEALDEHTKKINIFKEENYPSSNESSDKIRNIIPFLGYIPFQPQECDNIGTVKNKLAKHIFKIRDTRKRITEFKKLIQLESINKLENIELMDSCFVELNKLMLVFRERLEERSNLSHYSLSHYSFFKYKENLILTTLSWATKKNFENNGPFFESYYYIDGNVEIESSSAESKDENNISQDESYTQYKDESYTQYQNESYTQYKEINEEYTSDGSSTNNTKSSDSEYEYIESEEGEWYT